MLLQSFLKSRTKNQPKDNLEVFDLISTIKYKQGTTIWNIKHVATSIGCNKNKFVMLIINFIIPAFPVSGMVTIPVSMYQTVVANISQLTGGDGHTVMPIQVTMPHPTSLQAVTSVQPTDLKITAESSRNQMQADISSPPASQQPQIEILSISSEVTPTSTTITPMDSSNNGNGLSVTCTEGQ